VLHVVGILLPHIEKNSCITLVIYQESFHTKFWLLCIRWKWTSKQSDMTSCILVYAGYPH